MGSSKCIGVVGLLRRVRLRFAGRESMRMSPRFAAAGRAQPQAELDVPDKRFDLRHRWQVGAVGVVRRVRLPRRSRPPRSGQIGAAPTPIRRRTRFRVMGEPPARAEKGPTPCPFGQPSRADLARSDHPVRARSGSSLKERLLSRQCRPQAGSFGLSLLGASGSSWFSAWARRIVPT